jgi:hypothetical protein
MINISNEPTDTYRKSIKEEIIEEDTEKLLEKIPDKVNMKVQDTMNKELKMTQKQIKELREDFNKHQSETKDTIKKGIYKLKMTTQNIKEELNKSMENLRKKESNRNPGNKSPFSQTKKKQWKTTPADENKWKTESQRLKIK